MTKKRLIQQTAFAQSAFTLVELLVVIGIIALLIAILMPALNNANASAQRLKCLSNLRQMVLAAQSYVNQNQGYYPIAYYTVVNGSSVYSYAWDMSIITEPPAAARVVPGLLWQGDAPLKIQQCPTFDGKSNTPLDPYTGYNYNVSYIGHGQYENVMAPAKAVSIRMPSETAIFGDGQYVSGANKYMRAPFDSMGDDQFNGRWSGTQGYRHRGFTNAAFCDGHAESLKERYTNTDDYGGAENIAPGTGFLSPDNRLYGEH